jgi:epsilon-lactone hydrolase
MPAEWTATPEADPTRVVLFLHGGGYVSGSLASHRHMVAQAGREARARTLALGCRLAPEHPFPAAVEDAIAGYRFLLARSFAPSRIAVGGDSAGGGLAIAMAVSLRDAGIPLPGCIWCCSPCRDHAHGPGRPMGHRRQALRCASVLCAPSPDPVVRSSSNCRGY